MGDEGNTSASKKRAAGRELSRENPGLDDEDEFSGQEMGTFKRASEEVLANRRIVKVKRGQASSTLSAPSSNPFAAVCLVPPANSTPAYVAFNSLQEIENKERNDKLEENDKNTPVPNKEDSENKDKLDENNKNTPESEKKNLGNKDNAVGNDARNAEKKENLVESDENTPAARSVNSFQQLSSSQNAFTGLMGTGFSTSSFLFGSIPESNLPIFPSFSFGTNGNSSLFGNIDKKTEGTKITPSFKQNVQVETGEENLEDSFHSRFSDKDGKKGITFACMNSTGEGQNSLSTFALKFKDVLLVDEFCSVVMAHKGFPPQSTIVTTSHHRLWHPATTTITRPNKQSQGFYGSLSAVSVIPPPPPPPSLFTVVVSSPVVSTPNQWYDFPEQLATGLRRHRSTSSYPDLREQTPQWNQPVTGLNLSQPPFSH
ncbi:hypothetical protein R6Q59_036087 [Mikania micrantha]